MLPKDTPEYRRRRADECLAKAKSAKTEKEREQWLDLAKLWLTKPEQAEREDET